jgi:zonular occludens toxin Zot
MLTLIEGQKRHGKSYFAVEKIVEVLSTRERAIFTNLPLKREEIAQHVALVYERRKLVDRAGNLVQSTVDRIIWIREKIHLVSDEQIASFWNLPLEGSLFIIDELHRIWPAGNWRNMPQEVRDSFSLMGHGHVEIWAISQSKKNMDPVLRRHADVLYEVTNSIYSSMIPFPGLRWLHWPFQFFCYVKWTMSQGDKQDRESVSYRWPHGKGKRIFGLYDSFNKFDELPFLSTSIEGQNDSDTKADHLRSFWGRLADDVFGSQVRFICICIGLGLVVAFFTLTLKGCKATEAGPSAAPKVEAEKGSEFRSVSGAAVEVSAPPVVAVGRASAILSTGKVWRIGEWLIIGEYEYGLVGVSVQQRSFAWGARPPGTTGEIITAQKSVLMSGKLELDLKSRAGRAGREQRR